MEVKGEGHARLRALGLGQALGVGQPAARFPPQDPSPRSLAGSCPRKIQKPQDSMDFRPRAPPPWTEGLLVRNRHRDVLSGPTLNALRLILSPGQGRTLFQYRCGARGHPSGGGGLSTQAALAVLLRIGWQFTSESWFRRFLALKRRMSTCRPLDRL